MFELYSNYWEYGYGVLELPEGGYIVAGKAAVFTDSYDVQLIRTDDRGDTLWTKVYFKEGDESAYSIEPTSDGGYIITGMSWVMEGCLYLIKTDADFDTLWTRTFNGGYHSWGYSGQETSDGGYIAVGWATGPTNDQDAYVVKTDINGDSIWTQRIGGDYRDEGRCIQQTIDGNYIIAGVFQSDSGYVGDIWLICLSAETPVGNEVFDYYPREFRLNPPYPNPFNPITTITFDTPVRGLTQLTIYNVLGQKVATIINEPVQSGTHTVTWNPGDLPSGIYFCHMETEKVRQTQKLILLK